MTVSIDPAKVEDFHSAMLKKGREKEQANIAAARELAQDQRRVRELHAENRVLHIHHHLSLAEMYAKLSADHVRRAEALQGKEAV